jgi:NAD(P) transhydrogenase subunit alpha
MNPEDISQRASALADQAQRLSDSAQALATDTARLVIEHGQARALDPLVFGITVLVLAVFVGYYVVWRVTPALHSPLMAVTNAISSVIIVGALIAAGPGEISAAKILGFLAVILASVNIFGGFIVTQRMLQMFRRKQR